jgi:hypothetical protein
MQIHASLVRSGSHQTVDSVMLENSFVKVRLNSFPSGCTKAAADESAALPASETPHG